jgi:hypothetical protein
MNRKNLKSLKKINWTVIFLLPMNNKYKLNQKNLLIIIKKSRVKIKKKNIKLIKKIK